MRIIKRKRMKVTDTRTREISMWTQIDRLSAKRLHCIGCLHDDLGILTIYHRGKEKYIEKIWKTYDEVT